jgi:hypothetical protein
MYEFKVGDIVREIETGDIGTVTSTEVEYYTNHIWVKWSTSGYDNVDLHIDKYLIELVENTESDLDHMILTLVKAGYVVYKKDS